MTDVTSIAVAPELLISLLTLAWHQSPEETRATLDTLVTDLERVANIYESPDSLTAELGPHPNRKLVEHLRAHLVAMAMQAGPHDLDMDREIYIYAGQPSEVVAAAGVEGIVLQHFGDEKNRMFLRVKDAQDPDGFVDYLWAHDDASVRVSPTELASLYTTRDGRRFFDHSPNVLGLKPWTPPAAPPASMPDLNDTDDQP